MEVLKDLLEANAHLGGPRYGVLNANETDAIEAAIERFYGVTHRERAFMQLAVDLSREAVAV